VQIVHHGQLLDQTILLEAMQRLSPAHLQIVVETFFLGIPMAQLGMPAGTARSRLRYALSQLRRQLNADSGHAERPRVLTHRQGAQVYDHARQPAPQSLISILARAASLIPLATSVLGYHRRRPQSAAADPR
jgi:hypothetical protein